MSRNPFSSGWASAATGGGVETAQRPLGGLSYVAGATQDPLRFITIPQLLDEAVQLHGARDAAIFHAENRRFSWYDLQRESDAVAAGLLALGIRRGNRVGIWAPNRSEWLLAQFGTARIGAVLVNINPAYQPGELEYALNHVRCRALIMARGHKTNDYLATLRLLAPEIERPASERGLEARRLPHLKQVVVLADRHDRRAPIPARAWGFADFLAQAGPAQHARLAGLSSALDPDDAINIQFTSGTTGAPKGATLTHFNIVNNARFSAQAMALSAADRLCIPVPLYHCFGMVLGVLACATSGATMVFPGEAFDPAATLAAVQQHRCTALHGVPTMFSALLAEPLLPGRDLTTLRTGIMAGAPCPIETMRRVIAELHLPEITIAYGMTETSPVSFQSSVSDPLERRVATVGRVHPHVEVKIVDAEGRRVPTGQRGELCTRGYSVMRGYFDDPVHTREAIDEAGWMHTGDLATIDADGYCNIVGRVKDMLIRGGENVYPREVEAALLTHDAVSEAQVFGIPDPRYGEEVAAWVVAKPGQQPSAEDLIAHCRARIAHYKVPRHVRLVTAFPLTATGKPQKYRMREAMVRDLGLRDAMPTA